jgi:uncharacterized protein (TIGR02328 family)
MRLWHYKLIPVLPRQQLLGQWRECCLIAKNIVENGTPNHILVNPITSYSYDHLATYALMVDKEMERRGYVAIPTKFKQYLDSDAHIPCDQLYANWHTDQYLKQCLYNLQEKHDRGGISDEEWSLIQEVANQNGIEL